MLSMILSFIAGAVVMDIAWAYKTGVAQRVIARIRNRNS